MIFSFLLILTTAVTTYLIVKKITVRKLLSSSQHEDHKQLNQFNNTQKMIDDMPLMIVVEDKYHQRLMWNESFENAFSKQWDENNRAYNTNSLIADVFITQNNEVLHSQVCREYNIQLIDNNSKLVNIFYVKQPYLDLEGGVTGVMTLITQVSEVEEAFTQNDLIHQYLPQLVENIPGGFCQLEYFNNAEGRFTYLSLGAQKILGLADDYINHRGVVGCISPSVVDQDRVTIAKAFKEGASKGENIDCQFRYKSKNEIRRCRFIAIVNPQSLPEDEGASWHAILFDITEKLQRKNNVNLNKNKAIDEKGDLWHVFLDDEKLINLLDMCQVSYQQRNIKDFKDEFKKPVFIIVCEDDLDVYLGCDKVRKLAEFSGRIIVITKNKDDIYHLQNNLIKISYESINVVTLKEAFKMLAQGIQKKNKKDLPRKLSGNILVAEDNQVNQLLIQKQFESFGLKVTLADNGKTAFELLNTEPFQMVITDCNMPILDGFQLTSKIRQHRDVAVKCIPVIGMTADDSKEIINKALTGGMDCVIFKPYSLSQLYETLVEYLPQDVLLNSREEQLKDSLSDEVSLSHWVTVFGNKQDALAMAHVFHDTLKKDLIDLNHACAINDAKQYEKVLHRIKGSIVMVKIKTLASKIKACEIQLAEEGITKNNKSVTLISELTILNNMVASWLDKVD